MTKQLLIMRHAKSSWAESGISDFDRPLNNRGLRNAPAMGQFVCDQGYVPEAVFSSTAKRASTTADLFIEYCDGVSESQLQKLDAFYHAAPDIYLETLVRIQDTEVKTAMVIGHNPGLEALVYQLGGRFEPIPTAAIAVIVWEIDDWADILDFSVATLQAVWRPKEVS
jgi:phosphohistidine phosphatase